MGIDLNKYFSQMDSNALLKTYQGLLHFIETGIINDLDQRAADKINKETGGPYELREMTDELQKEMAKRLFQSQELLSKGRAYDQVRWERDIALEQLEEIGCSLGQKMDTISKGVGRMFKFDKTKPYYSVTADVCVINNNEYQDFFIDDIDFVGKYNDDTQELLSEYVAEELRNDILKELYQMKTDGAVYTLQMNIQFKCTYDYWTREADVDFDYEYEIISSKPCDFDKEYDDYWNYEYHSYGKPSIHPVEELPEDKSGIFDTDSPFDR